MHDWSRRKVKIVCTLGPSTRTREKIIEIMRAGMNVARLNFSHGSHTYHSELFQTVRSVASSEKRNIAIMQDLQGPKIRVGALPEPGIKVHVGDSLVLHPEGADPKMSLHGRRPLPISREIAEAIMKDLKVGARILFDDGKIATEVREVRAPEAVVEVTVGGVISSHKGMNLPGTPLSMSCLTDKDLKDLKLGLDLGVDAVALSFVRSMEDVIEIKELIEKNSNSSPLVISKMEREEAIANHESIIDVSDGLLVARGDMAVEVGADRVPIIQKKLIHSCNEVGVPVITATQMLESMVKCPTPTRAEASDVANAVWDGTDGVMLSAETASGDYPREAVAVMAKIVLEAERHQLEAALRKKQQPLAGIAVDAIEHAAAEIAELMDAAAIAVTTNSGMAARTLARHRPTKPIVAFMHNETALRKLAMVWGVHGQIAETFKDTDDLFDKIEEGLKRSGWAKDEDIIVVTAGIPSLMRGTTNMVKVHKVGASIERARGLPRQPAS